MHLFSAMKSHNQTNAPTCHLLYLHKVSKRLIKFSFDNGKRFIADCTIGRTITCTSFYQFHATESSFYCSKYKSTISFDLDFLNKLTHSPRFSSLGESLRNIHSFTSYVHFSFEYIQTQLWTNCIQLYKCIIVYDE